MGELVKQTDAEVVVGEFAKRRTDIYRLGILAKVVRETNISGPMLLQLLSGAVDEETDYIAGLSGTSWSGVLDQIDQLIEESKGN